MVESPLVMVVAKDDVVMALEDSVAEPLSVEEPLAEPLSVAEPVAEGEPVCAYVSLKCGGLTEGGELTTTVVGTDTPAAVCREDTNVSFQPSMENGCAWMGQGSTSLTRAVAHTVRNDSGLDISAASLVGAIAQTVAEVGVLAKT